MDTINTMRTPQLGEIDRLSACFEREIDSTDLDAGVVNESWTTARAIVEHVGSIYLWVAETVRIGSRAEKDPGWSLPPGAERGWFAAARGTMIERLRTTDPDRDCWTLAGPGHAAFWSGRMHMETLMHLGDLRTAGNTTPVAVGEAGVDAYADGIDEHLHLFLDRSRPTLPPLIRPLTLEATDGPRRWSISPDWKIDAGATPEPDATLLRATTGDLALFAWDRIEPLQHPDRFEVEGPIDVLAQYRAAPIHP